MTNDTIDDTFRSLLIDWNFNKVFMSSRSNARFPLSCDPLRTPRLANRSWSWKFCNNFTFGYDMLWIVTFQYVSLRSGHDVSQLLQHGLNRGLIMVIERIRSQQIMRSVVTKRRTFLNGSKFVYNQHDQFINWGQSYQIVTHLNRSCSQSLWSWQSCQLSRSPRLPSTICCNSLQCVTIQ